MKNYFKATIFLFLLAVLSLGVPPVAFADSLDEQVDFYVANNFDESGRGQLRATLLVKTDQLYFYVDNVWWNQLEKISQDELKASLSALAQEFESKIYPELTVIYGSEWKPGVDNDERITVLIHSMVEGAGGYVRTEDEYFAAQAQHSNQREMVYLNSLYALQPRLKSFLAHEFTHLIIFNQKDKKYKISEEIWLNEARADHSPALLGYDQEYLGSNLQQRIDLFLDAPSDSLTEWLNDKDDYGALNLFTQYLVDHYGVKVLVDSLHSPRIGIASLNEALQKNGYTQDFAQIFNDWTVAIYINDCQVGEKYCYKSENLKALKVTPQINFLPYADKASLSRTDYTKDWAGNWYKISGGKNSLKLKFTGSDQAKFKVLYVITGANQEVGVLELDKNQEGIIYVPDFRSGNKSLTILPTLQNKLLGFNGQEESYQFSFVASVIEMTPAEEAEAEAVLIEKLKQQIADLLAEISRVQAQINAVLASQNQSSCQRMDIDLYYGMRNSSAVRCLQGFLKSQGSDIYPEGIISGNFLSLTQTAVIRFQEKYSTDILKKYGLTVGTGYVGSTTRAKINQLLGK
ncbi:MAG: peptidoglycan-binding domain-containing protein [bacterium]